MTRRRTPKIRPLVHPDMLLHGVPAEDKFARCFIVQMNGCWEWVAALDTEGYGQFARGTARAHQFAWRIWRGPVPSGLHLDHLCRNRRCVNPNHLEPVTPATNALRGVGIAALNARRTHCLRGHVLPAPVLAGGRMRRICKPCAAERNKVFDQRRRARLRSAA